MTERVYTAVQLTGLPSNGIEALKIRALFNAYGGGYDFCRFFRQGDTFLACLDGSFVICEGSAPDREELAGFLSLNGFTDLFCSEAAANSLRGRISAEFSRVELMEIKIPEKRGGVLSECTPSEAWKIISSRFPIEFEPWYLDISHRVRHGVSRCVSNGKAALVVQHSINGESLISQVAVYPEFERQGFAAELLRDTCAALGGRVNVVCEDALTGFYEKCGFRRIGYRYCAVRTCRGIQTARAKERR